MSSPDLLLRHFDFLHAELPRLAAGLVDGWTDALRGVAAGGGPEANYARPLALLLAKERDRFIASLQREIGDGLRGDAIRRDTKPKPAFQLATSLDALTLVDEDQAERDIEISRVVQGVDLHAEWEWRELLGLLAGLQAGGDAGLRLDAQSHPASPLAIARGLAQALQVLQPTPVQRTLLMRLAIPICASQLQTIYQRTGQWLRAQGAQQGAYRVRGQHEPKRPAGLPEAAAALRSSNAGQADAQALLPRLFDQIARDPRLDRRVQQSILRLELAVLRLAQADPSLLLDEP